MKIIIVTGTPGTGKSSVSKKLSAKLRVPLISKDSIQCDIFEKYGFNSNKEKKLLGVKADEICFGMIAGYCRCNENVLCDKYLKNDVFFSKLASLQKAGTAEIVIVYLTANSRTITDRYNNRTRQERPISMETINVYPFKEGVSQIWPPIAIETVEKMINAHNSLIDSIENMKIIKIDTTSLSVDEVVDELLKNEDIKNVHEV